MTRHTFEVICGQQAEGLPGYQTIRPSGRPAIPLRNQLMIFLWYFGSLEPLCREDMRFTHCYAGWPGSCHDSRVLRNTDLFLNGQDLCQNAHLKGDGGFPLKEWFGDNGHVQPNRNFTTTAIHQHAML
ncbi:hypothetical protein DPMN_006977 [Dreissena polymorpha]|uniref:DDE Tnp4 domain-containing protein n=1 Tax=Dreissena polymorpha TaxID=45954 RepID=A0A9D4MWG8_DREPO|nr:hypothetical protein DPMN_006977 [Dreissena polymorpha]